MFCVHVWTEILMLIFLPSDKRGDVHADLCKRGPMLYNLSHSAPPAGAERGTFKRGAPAQPQPKPGNTTKRGEIGGKAAPRQLPKAPRGTSPAVAERGSAPPANAEKGARSRPSRCRRQHLPKGALTHPGPWPKVVDRRPPHTPTACNPANARINGFIPPASHANAHLIYRAFCSHDPSLV